MVDATCASRAEAERNDVVGDGFGIARGRFPSRGIASGGMLSDHALCSTPSGRHAGGTEYSVLVVAVDNGEAAHGAGGLGEARFVDDAAVARGRVR